MSSASPDPIILDYIRANRAAYSREAIERELQASGHTPEAIAAAWAALETGEMPVVAPDAPPQPSAEPIFPDYDQPSPNTPPEDAPPPSVARDPAIGRYIHENRSTYTRPAITDSLLASGHSRADIDATWAEIAAAEAPPPRSPEAQADRRAILNSWRFWLTAVATSITLLALPTALTLAFPDQAIGPGVSCVLLIGFVAAGLIMLGIGKARDVAYGLLAGVGVLFALAILLTILGFILLVIIFGICLVVLGQSGFNP